MKRKHIKFILIAACLMLFAGVLTACRQDILTLGDLKERGYDCEVVFDLNGGTSGSRELTELKQYAKSGSPIVRPGANTASGKEPTREGYTLGGYYRGTKEGDTITYGEKWDFAKDRVTGNLTLYAKWLKDYELVIHYGENFAETQTVFVDQSEDGTPLALKRPVIKDYTVIAFYDSKEKAEAKNEAEALEFPYENTADKFSDETPTWDIWADAIKGTFTVVRTAADFKLSSATNIYLLANIDFGGATLSFPDVYQGKFYGNGHTLSNFKVERLSEDKPVDKYLGLFGTLAGVAEIRDVTFDEVTLDITATNPLVNHYYVGAFAGRAVEGATLEKVTFNGTMTYNIAGQTVGEPEIDEFICSVDAGANISDCHHTVTLIDAKPAE